MTVALHRLRSTSGAIDLMSIMVGAIVMLVLAGIIGASVFVVIPWAQDNAAKTSLDAVAEAQQVARAKDRAYRDGDQLRDSKLLSELPSGMIVAASSDGSCYVASSLSATGKRFYASSEEPSISEIGPTPASCSAAMALSPTAMVTTWDTSPEACRSVKLPITGVTSAGDDRLTVDWGDGTVQEYPSGSPDISHTYAEGTSRQKIVVDGLFTGWGDPTSASCLTAVTRWGETGTTDLSRAFSTATKFVELAEIPSGVTTMAHMFYGAKSFNQALPESFDTSEVTDMYAMFSNASSYKQPLPDSFSTSQVTRMDYMFYGTKFGADISSWDVSKVASWGNFSTYSSLAPERVPPKFR